MTSTGANKVSAVLAFIALLALKLLHVLGTPCVNQNAL